MSLTDPSRPIREFLHEFDRLRSENEAMKNRLNSVTLVIATHQLIHGPISHPANTSQLSIPNRAHLARLLLNDGLQLDHDGHVHLTASGLNGDTVLTAV